jgi:broad specificity phosphatase PhoE
MATRTGHATLLIRHGETAWALSGQHTGVTDIPLTERGRRHAKLLSQRLAERTFAAVFTSPLSRARDTAAIAGLGEQAEVLEDLREVDYGDYEGRKTLDIRAERPGWNLWRDGTPNGETILEAGVRADRVIKRRLDIDGDVAIFAHGHFLRILGARWAGLAPEGGMGLALGTAALCDLGWERERRVIWLWNDTSHMDAHPGRATGARREEDAQLPSSASSGA